MSGDESRRTVEDKQGLVGPSVFTALLDGRLKPLTTVDPPRSRFAELDFVRAVAIVFVVMLHAASPILYRIGTVPTGVWFAHNIIDSALRVCVPLFFMTSGYLLLAGRSESEHPLREVGRRLLRIGLPLVAWALFYRLASAYANGQPITLELIAATVGEVAVAAPVYHLWFLYELAILYVFLPVLRPLFAQGGRPAIYFLALWLGLALLTFLFQLAGLGSWPKNFLDLGNSGYLVAGYLVRLRYGTPERGTVIMAALGYASCTAAIAALTAWKSFDAGAFTEAFYVYSSFFVIVQSICAFVVLLKLGKILQRSAPPVFAGFRQLSAISFGVYFLHVFLLERVGYNVLTFPSDTPWDAVAAIGLTALFAIATSFVFVWPLGRFRATRWLVK